MSVCSRLVSAALALVALIGCTAPEESAARWEKYGAQGNALPVQDGPWACVHDHDTGLLWEAKSDNEGMYYAGSTYYWKMEAPVYDGGCMLKPGQSSACDIDMLIEHMRSTRRCGRDDWRLPRMAELETLLYDTGFPGNARTVTGFFPHGGRAAFWTADTGTDQRGRNAAMVLDFGSSEKQWLPLDQVARVRLVSGP
ncbi:MAG: DUF1566 domain-containing protein [Alcanivorax sp.]|nr:DUF1566 domain-containing protein [Alcanivorax sp.]